MKRAVLIGFLSVACAAEIPDLRATHPGGYARLVEIVPQCRKVTIENYSPCQTASEILEAPSPQQATAEMLFFWERTVFRRPATRGSAAGIIVDPVDVPIENVIREDALQSTKGIVLPALLAVYRSFPGPYSKQMSAQLERVVLDSRASFVSFQEAHMRAMATPESSPTIGEK